MWIVMTSCKTGDKYNVALVKLDAEYTRKGLVPKMLTKFGKGVEESRPLGAFHAVFNDNKELKENCALFCALEHANQMADELNNKPAKIVSTEIHNTVRGKIMSLRESVYDALKEEYSLPKMHQMKRRVDTPSGRFPQRIRL